ncbi:hypothetical protein SAY86_008269 [Trapa natans]|uniref:Aldehyde dehydrogenase n=1 Tax=Trapa natans TaxID=22666 RepID=A0AAN7KEF7_TRANT|nr:hypothetical protein SAY86_008269 [Trapa natans]
MNGVYCNSLEGFRPISGGGRSLIFRCLFTDKSKLPLLPAPASCPTISLCLCSASTSAVHPVMADNKDVFDTREASLLVRELRSIFKSGRTKSYDWRISQLKGIERMMEEREKDIVEALHLDLSRPELESIIAEISGLKSASKKAMKELKKWMMSEKVKTSMTTYPSSAEIVPEPLGVVLIISTWNYPFLLSLDPVIGAIAAGNAVVLKPSEVAPATSSLLAKLLDEYLDNSAIRVIEGAVPEATALLEQKWDKILYTGSARVGRIVMAAAARHLTPVILELGGKCPAIVDSNVKLEVCARRIIAGKWAANCGQACISIDYIITTKIFASKLIDALKQALEESFGENPMESKDMSRIVNLFHFKRLVGLLDEDQVTDKIVLGGQRDEKLLKIAPTVLLDVPEDSQIMQEEIFGPLLPILTVETLEESFELINSRQKPLAAYLFTNDEQMKKKFVQNVSAGGMAINDAIIHVTVPGLPFGGVGESGMGAYHGKFSFDAFSHKKGVLYRGFEGDSSLRYPPYTQKKQTLMKALLNGNIIGIILALIKWYGK